MDPLNDDCMDYIFDYLDLPSKVNFACVSRECSEHFKRWAARKLKVVKKSTLEGLSEFEKKSLVRFAGEFIQNIELCSDFLPEICQFCTDLKHLHMSLNYRRSLETQIPGIARIKSLQSLRYDVEGIWNETLENLVKTISELPKLRKLTLNSEGYEGKYLKDLKHIKILKLSSVKSLKAEHLEDLCRTTKTLGYLYLGNDNSTPSDLDKRMQEALRKCKSLKQLTRVNVL